jgi:hypothetical protein
MKKMIYFLVIMSFINLRSQNFVKNDFLNNDWFSNVIADTISSTDTITMFSVIMFKTKNKFLHKHHIAHFYSKQVLREDFLFSKMTFNQNDTIFFTKMFMLPCGFVYTENQGLWKFNEAIQTFELSYKEKLSKFKIIGRKEEEITIDSNYGTSPIKFKAKYLVIKLLKIK